MVQQITPQDLARKLADGQAVTLIDVRQPKEHAFAAIAGSTLIPLNELAARVGEIPVKPNVPIVVYCHHGMRSQTAAAHLEKAGLSGVFSLTGGIEAWSCDVDPSVPRY